MLDEDRKNLIKVRLEHAEECLQSAKELEQSGDYRGSANRSYYAIFHSMRAVLANDGVDMRKHSGVIAEFRKRYIKTGKLDTQLSDIISILFDARTGSDYNDFYLISKKEVKDQIENAQFFVESVKGYLKEENSLDPNKIKKE